MSTPSDHAAPTDPAAPAEDTGPAEDAAPVTFADLGLRPELQTALAALGYEEPTPIQAESIAPLLEGRDLLGQAATGTGKTAAFALPVLHRLHDTGKRPQALVLVPTRELAIQVAEATHRYGKGIGARVLPIYGGSPIGRQIRTLEAGVDVVVATPGRALDHLHRGTLDLDGLTTVVLDEADEMLDMGFAEDIEAILSAAPADRQTVLFSATLPARITGMVKRFLRDPVRVRIHAQPPLTGHAPLVREVAYLVPRAHKASALGRLLDIEAPAAAIVFCRTREEVDTLAETMTARGYRAEALHGGMTQDQRDRVMGRLRAGTADLLVATDVAARGLDVEALSHVVNYDVPSAPDSYVHRVGRVGRAGREGVAITLAEPRQHHLLKTIQKVTGHQIAVEKLPTVADLRARRLELTRAALYETLQEEDLDTFRVVVDSLIDDHDLMEVALAAVKLAHEAATGSATEDDIPEVTPPAPRERPAAKSRPGAPAGARSGPRSAGGGAGSASARSASALSGAEGRDSIKLFVGLGRAAQIRPQDLVGAIANESSLSGRDIGAISIGQRFSTVEIPAAASDEVIAALRATRIKGRQATVDVFRPRHHPTD